VKREAILAALRRLGELSKAEGIKLEVSIYGGTAFMLAYNSRAMTRDVDALLKPKEEGERLVQIVAEEMGLEKEWLNSNVQLFLSPKIESKRRLAWIEDETNLIIHVPTAKYLLAMKAIACRRTLGDYPGDMEDLAFLIKKMEIRSVAQIQEAIDVFYPDDVIPEDDHFRLQRLIDQNEKERVD
jgi:hypothetical protein